MSSFVILSGISARTSSGATKTNEVSPFSYQNAPPVPLLPPPEKLYRNNCRYSNHERQIMTHKRLQAKLAERKEKNNKKLCLIFLFLEVDILCDQLAKGVL
jgi:hypothetical protein